MYLKIVRNNISVYIDTNESVLNTHNLKFGQTVGLYGINHVVVGFSVTQQEAKRTIILAQELTGKLFFIPPAKLSEFIRHENAINFEILRSIINKSYTIEILTQLPVKTEIEKSANIQGDEEKNSQFRQFLRNKHISTPMGTIIEYLSKQNSGEDVSYYGTKTKSDAEKYQKFCKQRLQFWQDKDERDQAIESIVNMMGGKIESKEEEEEGDQEEEVFSKTPSNI